MGERRSFKAARQKEYIEPFDLEYEDKSGATQTTEWKAHLPLPGALVFDVTNMKVDENAVALRDIFQAALRDDYERFWAFVKDPEHLIDADTIADVVAWMIEESTGRPTTPSSP